MSEQGWRGFLAAQAVEDRVVLHGGATAVFRVGSLGEAARLAEAVAKVPGLEGSGALLAMAAAASSTNRMHRRAGRSRTARVTAFVSARGQMDPPIDR